MFLRFYNIEQIYSYGWDQSRDAWHMVSLFQGENILEGPKTGVGNFRLGPVYFYLLAPFFFLTGFDPIASQYFNMLINVAAFVLIFYVTKKLFSQPLAFIIVGMYSINTYIVAANRIPWNVSLVPVLSFLIFYFTYKTLKDKQYKWVAALLTCCGIFFHAHFTAFIFPIMLVLLCLVTSDRLRLFKLFILALPFYLIWFVPTVIFYFQNLGSQNSLVQDFFNFYFVGVHLQFVLHRLPDVLIQFRMLLSLQTVVASYVFVLLIGVASFFVKDKLIPKIIFAWIIATLTIFGVYGGPISDYYFFFMLPAVYYSLLIIFQAVSRFNKYLAITILILFLGYYCFVNIQQGYSTGDDKGLAYQKAVMQRDASVSRYRPYNEGDIQSYLYALYTNTLFR